MAAYTPVFWASSYVLGASISSNFVSKHKNPDVSMSILKMAADRQIYNLAKDKKVKNSLNVASFVEGE